MKIFLLLVVLVGGLSISVSAQQSLDALVDRELPQLVNTYKMLHAAPELSHYEAKTSAFARRSGVVWRDRRLPKLKCWHEPNAELLI